MLAPMLLPHAIPSGDGPGLLGQLAAIEGGECSASIGSHDPRQVNNVSSPNQGLKSSPSTSTNPSLAGRLVLDYRCRR